MKDKFAVSIAFEMVADKSDIRTDIGNGLSTIGSIEGKNFASHERVNHSSIICHHHID